MEGHRRPGQPAALRVRVLGGFEVEGVDEREFGSRKGRLLAKRLAVAAGRPVAVDQLVEAVWPDGAPKQVGAQLSVLVSRLRAALGPDRVRRTDDGYQLRLDWLDVLELERRADDVEHRLALGQLAGATAAAQAALALARGPVLPEDDAAWVDGARARVARSLLRIRLSAAQAALGVGDAIGARFAAEEALQEEPYDEAALRLLMRAHAAAGNAAAAVAAYARFRQRLAEDLGVDPSAETDEVHLAVLGGALDHDVHRETGFVGRQDELRQLDYVLQEAVAGGAGAVVVEAPPGTGKSALLTAWAGSPAVSQALCVVGRCDELGRDLPLQPVIDGVLRHLDRSGDDPSSMLAPDVLMLAPLLGMTTDRSSGGGTQVPDVEGGRRTLFRALLDLLRRLAGPRPVVLVVDDLHVAAPGTVAFLAYALQWGQRVAVVAASRPVRRDRLPDVPRLPLGPLDPAAIAALVGPERAPRLHDRTGGHPLFLAALADADDDELPQTVVDAVREGLDAVGAAATTVQVAALLGRVIDVEVVARIVRRDLADVLDDLDVALQARLLEPREMSLAFTHDVVREVVERTMSPARASAVHAAAADALSRRPDVEPLALARHARLAGDPVAASAALVHAADVASSRYDLEAAGALLDEAVALADNADARLARARLRLATVRIPAALDDARRALQLGGGAAALEVAGWVSYYGRDYEAARQYADEGVARSTDVALRASCLALAGRIRHTRGDLHGAGERLGQAVAVATPEVRGVALVWHAALLVHRGQLAQAVDAARRGLLEPARSHPFAEWHGHFALAHALGAMGRWGDAMRALDDLDLMSHRLGDAGSRFVPVTRNTRGWLLRAAGAVEQAASLHRSVAEQLVGGDFLEPYYVSLLDLAEDELFAADLDAAADALERADGVRTWEGSMSWRHRLRIDLVDARVRFARDDLTGAEELADVVLRRAEALGDERYATRAALLRDTARASRGTELPVEVLSDAVAALQRSGGPDAWRDLALLASALPGDALRHEADRMAAALVGQVAQRQELDSDRCARWIRSHLDDRCR